MNKLTKAKMERMCRAAGMRPERRETIGAHELYVADGFSLPPHQAFRWFGDIEPNEFPKGMYATLWWLGKGEDGVDYGGIFFCDAFHEPLLTVDGKKMVRMHRAVQEAQEFLGRRKKAQNGH